MATLTTTAKPLRLDGLQNTNWQAHAQPVAILNEASTLHERIAYCWGLSSQVKELMLLFVSSEDENMRMAGSLLSTQALALNAMLHRLGSDTKPSGEVANHDA